MTLNRRRRIALLASSYLDALEQERPTFDRRPKPGHRHLLRESELWRNGSYEEFERALNMLRLVDRLKYRWFYWIYVRGEKIKDLAPHKFAAAVQGLSYVDDHMPANVYVPVEISENAGFLPSVAMTARMPRKAA